MRVGLLLIGDELLSGKIKDRNGYLVARTCFAQGFELKEIRVVPDEIATIASAVKQMSEQWDLVITSGGIGPTHDDKTFAALGKAFDLPLEIHESTHEKLQVFLEGRGQKLNRARTKMVRFPKGVSVETFPNLWLPLVSLGHVYVLPGVPALFEELLEPIFQRFQGNPKVLIEMGTQTLEGDLAEDLEKSTGKMARNRHWELSPRAGCRIQGENFGGGTERRNGGSSSLLAVAENWGHQALNRA